jgi:signal transduction histidine kinase/HAMP domain-containing protein
VRRGLGIRWWFALVLAVFSAAAAAAVARISLGGSEAAFRETAQTTAAGRTFQAAVSVSLRSGPDLQRALEALASRHGLSLFVFDENGDLATRSESRFVRLASVPSYRDAVLSALEGRRYIETNEHVRATVVATPLNRGVNRVLLGYLSHPSLAAGVTSVREQTLRAALGTAVAGGLLGLVVATLLTRRIRRIAAAAAAIEGGDFATPVASGFHDELGGLGLSIDRMRRRLRESFGRLESQRDRLEQLLERLHEGVVAVDSELRVDICNACAREVLGAPGLTTGAPLPDPWPGSPLRHLAAGLFVPDAAVSEIRVSPDAERTYSVVGLPPSPGTETAVLVLSDVSAAARRERAERDFVTNAAHQLRTPVTTITGAVDALQSGAKEIPEVRERFLVHIERESERLGRLIRALLVLTRAQTHEELPRLEPVELAPLLEDVAVTMERRQAVHVSVSCPDGLTALAERDLAEQAFLNLLENAVKHADSDTVRLVARQLPAGWVSIEVKDSGFGIAVDDQARVFDRFYQGRGANGSGFGLGLAIVRQVAQALGGEVEIESDEGNGTTARVKLRTPTGERA